MKLIELSALLLAGNAVALKQYVSKKQRAELKDRIVRDSNEMAAFMPKSLGIALVATSEALDVPAMVDAGIMSRMEDIGCEGENCLDDGGVLKLDALFGYGCWCFFGNINSAYGRGPPLDAYDGICQRLTLCYRCIFVDAENESDDGCDPFTVEFQAGLTLSGSFGISNVTANCQTDNQENCAWRTCSCAMSMITAFFNLSFDSQNVYDDSLKHSEGFDYNLECPQQGRALDRQCCGFYPLRRTYDRGEARDCCHSRTIFNPMRHVCCDDGSHVGLGNRC